MKRLTVFAIVVSLAIPTIGVITTSQSTAAPSPNVCQSTSDQPREYDHGSPLTGLVPPNDYYYLSVAAGAGCPVGPVVHLIATIQVSQVVPAVGSPGVTPAPARDQMWWLLFHLGSGDTGQGFSLTNDAAHVTVTGGTVMPCNPPPDFNDQACLCVSGTNTIVMQYIGPDVFGLGQGGAAGFRINNMAEDGAIVTDSATLTIVPS
jgi:hypothetical protein